MLAAHATGGTVSARPQPAPQGEGVRVHVRSVGICGSDLHLAALELPVVLGHEMAGTLDDGTAVAVEPLDPCGACDACRAGSYHHCVRGPEMILGIGRDGGMAEQVLIPAGAVVRLPAGLSLADACLVEPMAVAVHGIRRGQVGPGDRVAVVGGGSIGQLAAVAAQAAGAATDGVARHPAQHQAFATLGSGVADQSGAYDVVVEAAGTSEALSRAVALTRTGGRVVLLGSYWGPVALPGLDICLREIDLVPAMMYGRSGPSRDVDVAAAVLAERSEVAATVITHRFPLAEVGRAFATARDRDAGAIKVVCEP